MDSLSSMSDLAIRLRSVVKRFGEIVAVDGLDLDVPQGTCVGLLGPHRAGEARAMKMLTPQRSAVAGARARAKAPAPPRRPAGKWRRAAGGQPPPPPLRPGAGPPPPPALARRADGR